MNADISWLQSRLEDDGPPLIIDGGMGTELEKSGVAMHGKAWSATAVLSHPDRVREIHESFIAAGAEVIIANSFAAGRHMLAPAGLGAEVELINRNAVALARQARDYRAEQPVAVAGSICEWTTSSDSRWYRVDAVRQSAVEQAELLAAAGVDLILLEMCELIEFSEAVIEAALTVNLPIWIGASARSFAGQSELSVFGEAERDFDSLIRALARYPAALMAVMHTPIHDVPMALEIVTRHWRGATGVYPESGHFLMPNWQFVDIIEPDELVRQARSWMASGAGMFGGCCGLGPEHIRALKQAL